MTTPRKFYVFFNEKEHEFPWTVVWLRPIGIAQGKKIYRVTRVNIQGYEVLQVDERLDRTRPALLGRRVGPDEWPPDLKAVLEVG